MKLLKTAAAWILTVILALLAVARFTLDWIGRSTAPEDFSSLLNKIPAVLNWLVATPWYLMFCLWLLSVFAFAAALLHGTKPAATTRQADERAERTKLNLWYRSGDVTPERINFENLHRYFSLSSIAHELGSEETKQTVLTTTLFITYDRPVRHPSISVRLSEYVPYEVKDWSDRHCIIVFSGMPKGSVEVTTY